MEYISIFLGIIYLLSCPILVALNIKEFDYYCAFYLIIPATSYTLYNLKRIIRNDEADRKKDQSNEEMHIDKEQDNKKKIDTYFKFFSITYIVFCVGATCLLNTVQIAAFAFFPLTIRTMGINIKFILDKN